MMIFELPAQRDSAGQRGVAIGSCRIVNPIGVLGKRGDLKVCETGLQATHSMAEALQTLRYIAGDIEIPDRLSPYIFDTAQSPSPAGLARTLENGVDTFVVEVSDDRNFYYRDICLQQNFFSINFIRPHGGALLAWFREVCARRPITEALIETALGQLRDAGHRHDQDIADILRNVHYERQSEEETAADLAVMMKRWPGRWFIVGAFDVPGYDGAITQHRREANANLDSAARRGGAVFYDPSELVARHGRATALDGGGADIYEYAPAFFPTVGDALVRLLRTGQPGEDQPSTVDAPFETGPGAAFHERSRLADQVNAQLLELHRERLAAMGVVSSGLGPHYQGAVERETIVGPRERGALELIAAHLPAYDAYAVMRAGLGELALLIAASGRKAIAFEPYPARRAAIEAGKARLEACGLLAPGLLTVVPSLTPAGPMEGQVLGVGLDVAHVSNEADAAPHFANLAAFEALLIGLPSFLRRRATQGDIDFAEARLRDLGFVMRRDYAGDRLSWFHRRPNASE